jgi:hypothetical protein
MNWKGSFVVAVSLLLGAGLAAALPGVGLQTAEAQEMAANPGENPAGNPGGNPALAAQFLHVEWAAGTGRYGDSRIIGYVYNDYGRDAQNVRLRITEFDASGHPVSSILRPVNDTVPTLGRAYFDVQVPNSAAYEVAVDSFEFLPDLK